MTGRRSSFLVFETSSQQISRLPGRHSPVDPGAKVGTGRSGPVTSSPGPTSRNRDHRYWNSRFAIPKHALLVAPAKCEQQSDNFRPYLRFFERVAYFSFLPPQPYVRISDLSPPPRYDSLLNFNSTIIMYEHKLGSFVKH
ncbi:unnamed protein product [Calypogeia fissa]